MRLMNEESKSSETKSKPFLSELLIQWDQSKIQFLSAI